MLASGRETRARTRRSFLAFGASFVGVLACSSTVDSIGSDEPIPLGPHSASLGPLTCRSPAPNAFAQVLGVTTGQVMQKLDGAFQQLFYGDPTTESFYVRVGIDQAYIWDTVHGGVRTEGMGLGMNIAVKLGRRDEFDRLWRYAQANLRLNEGAARGYYRSGCDSDSGTVECLDPYGIQQFAMALVFAHDRWGSSVADINYEQDAVAIFELMVGKELDNGGIVDGITDLFDDRTHLPPDEPLVGALGYTRPAAVMPAYYGLWAEVTGERFWDQSAKSGRAYWQRAAHPVTGLLPVRAYFDGTPVEGGENYDPEGYRTQLNLALDVLWNGDDVWEIDESNKIIDFFAARAGQEFCRVFSLDGANCLDNEAVPSLAVVNGLTALGATTANRDAFVQALWELDVPRDYSRYYGGLLYLLGLMAVGGQYPVCGGA